MQKQLKKKSTQERYQALIRRQQISGLTIRQFCTKNRISPWCFYHWRKRLSGTPVTLSKKTEFHPKPIQQFLPLTVASDLSYRPPGPRGVEIAIFKDSLRVALPLNYPIDSLHALIEVLRNQERVQ